MAKVVPLANAKAFLDALEKSGLVKASDVESFRSARAEDSDPKLVARDLVRENKLTKWQAGQLLHGFHQLMVGKYKLMDQLGTGEMGRVYLAEHAQLARKVSLKILSRKYTANPDILKKVLEDGRKAAALDHRNLSHVFDVNSEDERYYLVTEFVEGKDLRQLVEASGATSPAQATEIIRQAAEGLEHAHGQGVIHGDLKPSNLIIDPSGVVKILDLGLARLTETSPAVGDESTEVATLAAQSFHAPEQSSKHVVSPLVDVFSLGGILFYVLSGKPPLGNVKKSEDVKEACPAASDELAELCARMLSEDPAARPQTARQVIEGLDAAARAKPKQVVKEEKKPSNGEKPQVKQKKPLVAKSLEIPFPIEEIKSERVAVAPVVGEPPAVGDATSVSAPPADDPFSGFSLQTKRTRQKPALQTAVATVTAAAAPSDADAPPTSATSGQKPSMAIVIGVGIGGGVLILALGVTALVWAMSRGSKTIEKTAVAKAETTPGTATPPPAESNPEVNPEENPKVETPAAAAKTLEKTTPEKTTPAGTPEVPKITVPMPNPAATDPVKTGAKPPLPMPGATPAPPTVTTTPSPKPEPVKPEPAKSEPVKPTPVKPVPMPEPAAPVANPFFGFAKTLTLPQLEEKGKPVEGATKPFLLGTVKIPPKLLCLINLKGGDNAISINARQKFVLTAGNNGTSERDWEIKVTTEGATTPPVIVARLALQDDQLNFQWTDEAAKQFSAAPYSAAPYLCNCLLTMSAGTGSHQLALRQPLTGEPLKVDLEKPMSAKYTIDYPPNPKQIVIQLGPPEGEFTKFKFDQAELIAKKDSTMFMTGPADDVMLLHFRLECTMPSKLLTMSGKVGYQIHGMTQPKPWLKSVMAQIGPATEQANQFAKKKLEELAKSPLKVEEKTAAQTQVNKEVADTDKQKAQAVMLTELAKKLHGTAKIHFHIVYEIDTETKITLLTTGVSPPMVAKPMPAKP